MTEQTVDQFRTHLLARHRRAEVIRARFAAFAADMEATPKRTLDKVVARCDATPSCRRMVAQILSTDHGVLYAARITWRPTDRDIPPWQVDSLMDRAAEDHDLSDDDAVRGVMGLYATLAGPQVYGERAWMAGGPDHYVHDVLDLPSDPEAEPWLPTLWSRCDVHPSAVEQHDRAALIKAARDASTRKLYPVRTIDAQLHTEAQRRPLNH